MKRFLFVFLALGFCAGAASADEQVRAAQRRLQEEGFYFGEPNGAEGSETSAALSRYQIRHGLQITGRLEADTAQSLGLSGASAPTVAREPDPETWRRLRKADARFLSNLKDAPSPDSDTRRTLVLSRERLRDYAAAFILAGLAPAVEAELEFFGARVKYFDEGVVDRAKIRRDLRRYNRRWPERRFWLAGEVEVEPQADSRLRVSFPLRYELRNGAKRASGEVTKKLVVEVVGEDLEIVAVDEEK